MIFGCVSDVSDVLFWIFVGFFNSLHLFHFGWRFFRWCFFPLFFLGVDLLESLISGRVFHF